MRGSEKAVLLWVVALMIVAFGYLASPFVPWRRILNHQGLAAWVQALGSVAAIIVSVGIVELQHRRERLEERRRREAQATEQLAALIDLLDQARVQFGRPLACLPDGLAYYLFSEFRRARLDLTVEMLESYPWKTVQPWQAAFHLREAIDQFRVVNETLEQLVGSTDIDDHRRERLQRQLESAIDRVSLVKLTLIAGASNALTKV